MKVSQQRLLSVHSLRLYSIIPVFSSCLVISIRCLCFKDGRFPTSLPTTTLRRTIGVKKDEYSLDRKSASKADVMNLLESAGFSKSNPYYIVPQGRVSRLRFFLCGMSAHV